MKEKSFVFRSPLLPYALILPELIIISVFFLLPAFQAMLQSTLLQDPFGLKTQFVGLRNFEFLLEDEYYVAAFFRTIWLSVSIALITMPSGLLLAVAISSLGRNGRAYQTLAVWPYALAPVVAGVVWFFIMNPTIGVVSNALKALGYEWNPALRGGQAFLLITVAVSWKQIAYCFLFYMAGIQNIPRSFHEAAEVSGAGAGEKFLYITLPLVSPTTFFLFIMNFLYGVFETFGPIHQMTSGGPNHATTTLVYKVFADGFIGLNLGRSAAQSVIIMMFAIGLTLFQFKFVDRKVVY